MCRGCAPASGHRIECAVVIGDVTVIGAGPAGSLAALLLARRGWAVTLIEQHRFPRDKVCGECLSALGLEVLNRAGLTSGIEALGAVTLPTAGLHAADGTSTTLPLPRPMAGLSRLAFDLFLLNAARAAGIVIRQPMRCEFVASAGRPELRTRDLTDNTVQTLSPSFVIIANGKALAQRTRVSTATQLGIKAHFAGVDGPRDAIELFGCDGCYGGLAPIEDGRWNAAFSVPAYRVRAVGGDLGLLLTELCAENRMLGRRVSKATPLGPILASSLPRHRVVDHWPSRTIPIGNSAAALEPIGGEGMGLALRSAELAVEALADGIKSWSESGAITLRARYRTLWRTRRPACRIGGSLASWPIGASLAARLVGAGKGRLGRIALALVGK